MNTFIVPSNMISFSVFEHDHPCPDKYYNVVIFYKGDGKTPIIKPDIKGDIYHTTTLSSVNGWEGLLTKATAEVESKGF